MIKKMDLEFIVGKMVENMKVTGKKIKKSGLGNYYWSDGDRYEGHWLENMREGTGVYFYANGARYEGEWKHDKKCGKGTYFFKDGDKYEGDWFDGKMNGHGIYYFANGNKYIGQWKDSKKDGEGILYFYDGANYVGRWKDNERTGIGKVYYASGASFEGEYRDGLRNGIGTRRWIDGTTWTGFFKDHSPQGIGTYKFADGTTVQAKFFIALLEGNELLNLLGYERGKKELSNTLIDVHNFSGPILWKYKKEDLRILSLSNADEEIMANLIDETQEEIADWLGYPYLKLLNIIPHDFRKLLTNKWSTATQRTWHISKQRITCYSDIIQTRGPKLLLLLN